MSLFGKLIGNAPGGGSSIGGAISGATAGSVFFAGAAGVFAQDNTGLFYDDTDNILKVGVAGAANYVRIGRMNSPVDNYTGIAFGDNALGTSTAQLWGSSSQTVLSSTTETSFRLSGATEYARLNATSFNFYAASAARVPVKINLAAAQTADAFQVYASDGTTKLASVTKDGYLGVSQGAHNVSSIYNLSNTTTGISFGQLYYAINFLYGGFTVTTLTDGTTWNFGGTQITFNGSSPGGGGGDVGIARYGANTLKVNDAASGIRGLLGGGASVASATALPLPTGRIFHVTGTTTITSITSTNFQSGAIITLIFDDVLTFTDGSNLKLAGNLVTTADDTITLGYDGTNWYEICRSVN